MKKIEAIIRPDKYAEVKKALEAAGCPGLNVTEVAGHGVQKGVHKQFRGLKYHLGEIPKVKLEIVVPAKDERKIVKVILKAACTHKEGDGKIFVSPVEKAWRISSGESGEKVVS